MKLIVNRSTAAHKRQQSSSSAALETAGLRQSSDSVMATPRWCSQHFSRRIQKTDLRQNSPLTLTSRLRFRWRSSYAGHASPFQPRGFLAVARATSPPSPIGFGVGSLHSRATKAGAAGGLEPHDVPSRDFKSLASTIPPLRL